MSDEAIAAFNQTNFTAFDWAIVAVYLSVSVVIGLMVKRYATDMSTYIGAGRRVGTWLGIATMTGTELGLVTVMYSAQAGFKGGFAAFHMAVIAGVVTFFIGVTGFIVAPLRRERILTIPEFYEKRFGRRTRILGGVILAFAGILNMGLFLQVGSKFIVGVTGIDHVYGLPAVMTTLLVLVLIYTILGGMISVIITDYIQFVVLAFGMLLTSFFAVRELGWDNIFNVVHTEMGSSGFNPLEEGEFGVGYVIWMCLTAGLVGCAIWPTAVARALAMESPQAVKKQYMWSSVSFTIRFMVPYFWGICAFVFIMTQAPDLRQLFFPAEGSEAKPLDNLYALPAFFGRIIPAGFLGILSAAMIAAFMSTHDSYLLCWSSVITQDVVAPLTNDKLSVKSRVLLTRIIIVLIGAFLLFWGMFYKANDLVWNYMAITGAIYFTGAFPLLVGGLYWKRASSTGAFCSLIAGCTALVGIEPIRKLVGGQLLPMFNENSAQLNPDEFTAAALKLVPTHAVGLFSVSLTIVVFVVGSLLFPDKNVEKAESA